MKQEKESGERRQHPRFFPYKDNLPEVRFIFDDGDKISVEVVNISRGGLLGSTSGIEQFLEIDHHKIKVIEIMPPNKEPFRCAGKLLRLHPIREDDKCFCAVEFCNIGEEEGETESEKRPETEQNSLAEESDYKFNETIFIRVEKAENYLHIPNSEQATKVRKVVYDSFSDITKNLPLEDKWWFYELLDEMKTREPDIPDELKQDFINICKIGLPSGTSVDGKKVKLGLVKR